MGSTVNNALKIFSGSANTDLTHEICEYLRCSMGKASITRFSDGEIYFQIDENVRGADVFIVQPSSTPVDSNLMELFLMIDAFKRSSARRITAVLPYFGYARQDRKDKPRVPISSKLVSDLLVASGTHRLLTMDLHAPQIQGFFSIPVDHLFAAPVLVEYFQKLNLPNLTVVSPDAGGVERARAFAKRLNAELAMVNKRRLEANVAQVMNVIGDVEGQNCLVVDDMIDTAGTLVKTVEALKDNGAMKVYACATHPVLSGPAVERIEKSQLEEVIVTNTIALPIEKRKCKKMRTLSVAKLLGEAVKARHDETSVSGLFI
ncbi:MAG TPA: ribose-phosphate pyrophosphokinase [Pyrinomonadaceae bacterium]|nr:ribose-phosphate pyrophosphokinase [Pyrinomonadaceae bacterium]